MKKKILTGMTPWLITAFAILLLVAIITSAGCQKINTNVSVSNKTETPNATEKPPVDMVEKRGYKTNITEFSELLTRASGISSFKYNITDTQLFGNDEYKVFTLNRFVKIMLPKAKKYPTGEPYDEILMDRVTKTAFSHCSKYLCPKPNIDRELEFVEYDDYYIQDPYEYISKATDVTFVKEELVGEQYTKVFNATYEGKPARIWVQEYYGFPIKIMVKNPDSTMRTIKFEDVMVDATRSGEIDTPSNFTIKGEQGSWFFWKHYLGEWPPAGNQMGQKPMYSV